jgi:hypothetical protein
MADEIKTGKAPEGKGGTGTQKPAEGEVEAHGYRVYYNCWHCHFTNSVDSDWSWFRCFHCGHINYTN